MTTADTTPQVPSSEEARREKALVLALQTEGVRHHSDAIQAATAYLKFLSPEKEIQA